jgi:hypothetical protein
MGLANINVVKNKISLEISNQNISEQIASLLPMFLAAKLLKKFPVNKH